MWTPLSEPFFVSGAGSAFGFGGILIALLFICIAVWALVWKTLAVWHAARNKQRIWMIVLLLVNTVGVLEIIYLAWFRKDRNGVGSDALYPFLKDMKNPLRYETAPKVQAEGAEEKK